MGVDPVSLALVSTAVGAAGSAVSAYGSYESGQANAQAAAYQAQVAANNAKIATENSKLDIQAGETAASNQELKTRGTVGSEKASQGASGVDVNSGSAVDVRAGTEELGNLDAMTIRSNAAKKAYADQVTSASETAQSGLDTMKSSQASTAGEIGAASTLLSGASTVGSNWAKFQKVGGGTGSSTSVTNADGSTLTE